ncbi:hypothetical protein SHI21_12075 [Bacteriovorax sp. PP10]|uniref:Uncharacterized protein n=1 Tax=Bacteriovorax antarcticus TaxID=3088717 RepID=A0ABU5VVI3_9BACT|nr:hypothetical protein [Bacteriovorax sp. PP10]MEA9356952.1 hypothetical protein [Bacteriovorax sp. PP10]
MPLTTSGKVSVSNIQIIDHQIIITGVNLNSVVNFQVKDGSTLTSTQIESKTNTKLVANTLSNITFAAGKLLDFVLSDASAASTFVVNFSLCDAVFNGRGFDCSITAQEGDVLTFNSSNHKWEPRALNLSGLQYRGTWDATDVAGFPSGAVGGDYYIVNVETTGGGTHYNIGDWIVYSTALGTFEHVRNSVSKQEGDYSLTQLSDVDLSSPAPTNGMVLKYNSATSTWIPGTVTAGGSGTVTTVSVTPPLIVATATTTPALSISQASTSTNGYLSSADWNTFNTKEAALPTGGTAAQYLRGDKTLATLNTSVVPESGALYFTEARARATLITGFDNTLVGAIAAGDSIVQAFGKTQNQINTLSGGGSNYLVKNSTDTLSGAVTLTGTVDATSLGDIKVNGTPFGLTSAVSQSYVNTAVATKLDKTAGGTVAGSVSLDTDLKMKGSTSANYITVRAHATSGAYNFVLPSSGGTNGYVLSTDGAGNTSWIAAGGGGGAVSSVNTQTGAVVLTTDNIAQGSTNLYYTNANALGTTITAPTLTNSTIATSDTIQVAFGKLQAQLNNVVSQTLTGLAAGSNTVIAAGDTLLVALANLQAQITNQGTSKADKTNGAQAITASSLTATTVTATNLSVANPPLVGADAANKTYVDNSVTALGVWNKGASSSLNYTAGSVGVGTSTPGQQLSVADTFSITNASGTQYLLMGNQNSTGANHPAIIRSSNGTVEMGSGTSWTGTGGTFTSKFYMKDNGDVGLGYTPWNDFGVYRANSEAVADIISDNTSTNTARYPAIRVLNYAGSPSTGNAGNPSFSLINMRGNTSVSAPLRSGETIGAFSFNGSADTAGNYNEGAAIWANATELFSSTAAGTNLTFYTAGNGTKIAVQRMIVDQNGNVGIGSTTTPAAKLDVAGEVKFGNTSSTCNAANEGQQRYNSGTKVMEFCNATAWTAFGSGGGGGSGGLTGCPASYTLVAASNTHGTNSFCINTTIKADAVLPTQMSACMTEGAELCKNRQLSAAMDSLPAATLAEWTNVWTGDIVFGAVHNIVDVSTAAMMVYEAKSGWRQIGQKGPPMIYGNFTPNIPASSPFGGFCCKQ